MKPIGAIHKFFGLKQGQTLKQFADEIKALSPEEKHDIAKGACEEMGVELEEVSDV